MMLRHPIMVFAYLIDGRRPVPTLPAKSEKSRSATLPAIMQIDIRFAPVAELEATIAAPGDFP
jgi:hypothetical protein